MENTKTHSDPIIRTNRNFAQALDALISGTTQQIKRNHAPNFISIQKGSRDVSKEDTTGKTNVKGVPFHLFEMGAKDTVTRMPALILTQVFIDDIVTNIYIPSMDAILSEDWEYVEVLPLPNQPVKEG